MGTFAELTASLALPREAEAVVVAYLIRLNDLLPLPRGERTRIVAEAADTLACAIEDRIVTGTPPGRAARTAVAEFGDPAMLAKQFAAVIAPAAARRVCLALLLSGPMVGVAWATALGHGRHWATRIGSLLETQPYLPPLLMFTVAAAVTAVLGSRKMLWVNVSGRLATGAAWLATIGCLAADALLLATLITLIAGGAAPGVWVACAASLSCVRLTGAATAARRLARLRAAGG
jgi:hypothetical protein